jgi:hypothetical protein
VVDRLDKGIYPYPDVPLPFAIGWLHTHGLDVEIIGPQCMQASFRGLETVSNGQVVSTLTAIYPQSESAVESFLNSFQPIS